MLDDRKALMKKTESYRATAIVASCAAQRKHGVTICQTPDQLSER
jgi:hypothetical protein